MLQTRRITIAKAATVAAMVPFLLWANANGPDPGHTGAPADLGGATCLNCHLGTPLNGGPGSVSISFADGATYGPGQTKRVTVTVADPNQRRWGFQATARLGSDGAARAGTLTRVSPQTEVICAGANLLEQLCAPSLRQFVIHTTPASGTGSASFEFDWTAPDSDIGPVDFFVAGNAANGNGSVSGDRIYSTTARLTPEAAGSRPTISQNGVVSGASFQPGLAPASWVTLQGTNLANSQRTWDGAIVGGRLPEELDGVRVTVNGRPGFIFFISPGQINFQSPSDLSAGPVTVQVTNNGVQSEPVTATLAPVQPAFFLWQNKYAVATDPEFRLRAPENLFPGLTTIPARPGDVLILWSTGLGATNPAMPAGQVVPADGTIRNVAGQVTVRIGGIQAESFGAALSPNFVSLYQIAIRVPEAAAGGDQPVVVEVDGVSSPGEVFLFIQR